MSRGAFWFMDLGIMICSMGLLRSIWRDILWLNSFGPAVKVTGVILGVALIVGAWYVGTEWWTTPVNFVVNGMARKSPPLEIAVVIVGIILIVYITYVTDRDRDHYPDN